MQVCRGIAGHQVGVWREAVYGIFFANLLYLVLPSAP